MTAERLQELNAKGYLINVDDETFIKLFNNGNMANFNVIQFDEELSDELIKARTKEQRKAPELYRKPNEQNEIDKREISITPEHNFELAWSGTMGKKRFLLRRTFLENKTVNHDIFAVPEDYQGGGFSKQVFKSLYKQYQNVGIETVNVGANMAVGGYTWGKYGFTANENQYNILLTHAKDKLNGTKRMAKKINQEEYNDFVEWIKTFKGKDIPIHEVAYGKEYGKRLLLESSWDGYINFSDENARAIFEKYMSGTK
jgi:GNAT superfamily N-acetyltransferase